METATDCGKQGMTLEQTALMLGIGKTKLFKEINENEEFANAIKAGQARGIEKVTNALFESAMGGNTVAMVFYLKNRAGWADKKEVELNADIKLHPIEDFYEA